MLTEPPYEVTEFGWGEFETRIQIHFHDAHEKPVDIIHMLVLYPPGNQPASTKKPVISEFYDELVFNEPTEFFYKKLMAGACVCLCGRDHGATLCMALTRWFRMSRTRP